MNDVDRSRAAHASTNQVDTGLAEATQDEIPGRLAGSSHY